MKRLLTPDEAQKLWASRRPGWDSLNPERVQYYLELMKADRFVSDAVDCIVLVNGQLRCGHHRTKAISMMDRPVAIDIRSLDGRPTQ
jgi:hypothetical protein